MPDRGRGRPRKPLLEHPLTRRMLQQDLAHSGKSQAELAEKYDVDPSSISDFAARHRATIQQIIDDAANEFAGLAIASKAARLEVYRELIDACMTPVPKVAGKDGDWVRDEDGNVVYEIDASVAGKLLRNVAEELGHLPNRVTLSGGLDVTHTNYTVNGVSPEALK